MRTDLDLIPLISAGLAVLGLMRAFRTDGTSRNVVPPGEGAKSDDIWPMDQTLIKRVGQSIMGDRDGKGRPHKGLDIFADAGTVVVAARSGRVVRVVDGRKSDSESRRAAGLWIDIETTDDVLGKPIYRYLHLGKSLVSNKDIVKQGSPIGEIAEPNTSGLGKDPHLHFEIRKSDYTSLRNDYGAPIDPLSRFPTVRKSQ